MPYKTEESMSRMPGKQTDLYIVSYDISGNKRRRRVAKELENYGSRVQYSVFECRLTRQKYQELYHALVSLLSAEATEDSIRIYLLCANCAGKTVCIGNAKPGPDEEDVIVI